VTILSSTELRELTGASIRRLQRRVLDKSGIRYIERADGSLVTTWEAVNSVLCGQEAENDVTVELGWMQNLDSAQHGL